jgi:DNA ligase 3
MYGLQDEMKRKMEKVERDPSRVPSWLRINRVHVPDYIAKDPKVMPVFEVVGSEFTDSPVSIARVGGS